MLWPARNGQFKTLPQPTRRRSSPIAQDRLAIPAPSSPSRCWWCRSWRRQNEYLFRAILIPFLILSLAALGLNILVGYCGQISLGTGAFMAVGAYAAYNFQVRIDGMPLIASLLLGGVCATGGGRPVRHAQPAHQGPVPGGGHAGGAVLRRLGLPAHQVVHQRLVLGLGHGVAGLKVLGFASTPARSTCSAWLPGRCFALLAKNLVRSAIGREWMAIRDMDVAAA